LEEPRTEDVMLGGADEPLGRNQSGVVELNKLLSLAGRC